MSREEREAETKALSSTRIRYLLLGVVIVLVAYSLWWYKMDQIAAQKASSYEGVTLKYSPLLATDIAHWKDYEVLIPSGKFRMGCAWWQRGCTLEQTLHEVELTHAFYMMKGEISQGLWKQITGSNPSFFKDCGMDCPVEQVSWNDVIEFSNRLNERLGLEPCYENLGSKVIWSKSYDCKGWRLPTEAEWEFAAKGGESFAFAGHDDLRMVGWYLDNSAEKTYPPCKKKENGYGLCDMSGNVDEWVWDRDGVYPDLKQINPTGGEHNPNRVVRGGSFGCDAWSARVFDRGSDFPTNRVELLGVRFVRTKP